MSIPKKRAGFRRWRVGNNVYNFPAEWDKDTVVQWGNSPMRQCPVCRKIDVLRNHFESCDPAYENYRQENLEYYD